MVDEGFVDGLPAVADGFDVADYAGVRCFQGEAVEVDEADFLLFHFHDGEDAWVLMFAQVESCVKVAVDFRLETLVVKGVVDALGD